MMGLDSGEGLLNSPCYRNSCSLLNAIYAAGGSKENPPGRETLENLSPNLFCSLLTPCRADTVPLHAGAASRQSWQGQAFLEECDPTVISSPDQHADVQEQAVLSQKEVQ